VVTHKYRNAGQVCVAPTRFIVEEAVFDRFAMAPRGAQGHQGRQRAGGRVQMGPMANPRRPRRWTR
jgi:succinate-semialdehyde dehydrogenase/glutarate-semialdehyde dehydrogenase